MTASASTTCACRPPTASTSASRRRSRSPPASPAPATTSSMKEFDARFGNRTYPVPGRRHAAAPVGGRRGLRRVPRHRVPPRARQRAARDDRALPLRASSSPRARCSPTDGGALDESVRRPDERQPRRRSRRRSASALNDGPLRQPRRPVLQERPGRRLRGPPPRPRADRGQRGAGAVRRGQQGATPTSRRRASASRSTTRSGRSYENCPACAEIDALKSIPANVTAISLGGGGSIALSANKK